MILRFAPLALVSMLVACTEPPPPASTAIDLGAPTTTPLERIPLVPLALQSQADYDALEERWLPRRDPGELVRALNALADAQPEGKPDLLLLQRIAVLLADEVTPDGRGLQPALDASVRLRDAAPEDPHTLWLNGWVMWQLLTRNGRLQVDGESRTVAEALVQQWERLVATAPDYVGPREHNGAKVKASLERMRAALAEVGQPAATVAPAATRTATPVELEALDALDRFRGATEGNRRGICRDWSEREATPTRSLTERRMDLACAIHAGEPVLALQAIAALQGADGPAFDGCAALAQLQGRVTPAVFDAALRTHPLPFACP